MSILQVEDWYNAAVHCFWDSGLGAREWQIKSEMDDLISGDSGPERIDRNKNPGGV